MRPDWVVPRPARIPTPVPLFSATWQDTWRHPSRKVILQPTPHTVFGRPSSRLTHPPGAGNDRCRPGPRHGVWDAKAGPKLLMLPVPDVAPTPEPRRVASSAELDTARWCVPSARAAHVTKLELIKTTNGARFGCDSGVHAGTFSQVSTVGTSGACGYLTFPSNLGDQPRSGWALRHHKPQP